VAEFAQGVGERLSRERERLGLEPAAFAERLGINESRLAMLEQGEDPAGPAADELVGLASAGADVSYLLTGQRALSADESDLVDNYRASSPEKKTQPATAGDAVAEPQVT